MSGTGEQLPPGWAETTLGAVHLDLGRGVDPSRTPDDTFELYSVPSYEHSAPEITKGKNIGSNKKTVEPGTVLLCKINPRINRVWTTSNHSPHRKIASTEWIPFFPVYGVEPRYLAYFLRQGAVRDFLAGNASGVGGSLMRVRAETFCDFKFGLAPLTEQTRISDAIDELFSDLDAGVTALERGREKLKLYRASILKAAVEGMLTAEWRTEHPHTEPASELLQRILEERRRRWEEDQLDRFNAKGQEPPWNWKAKYKEPIPPDNDNLPPMPEGWCWATLDQLIWKLRSGTAETSGRDTSNFPVLKSSAVRHGIIDFEELNYLQHSQSLRPENFLQPRDFLITRLSGSVNYVGCSAVVKEVAYEAIQYPDRIFCGKLVPSVDATYLTYCFQHSLVRKKLEEAAKSTAGHKRISLSDLYPLLIALPPLDEQETIVEDVEDQLSIVDHIEVELEVKLKSGRGLRQAILRHAFTGQLVPQDPNDEPASELLKRIATERATRAREFAAAKRETKPHNGPKIGRRERPKKTAKGND